jgi:aspartyl-tRNA(Asn)/glutamyl-tRNA(Gln) amidotransferase subunit C
MLTLEEVEHIAALARLELSAEEKERYRAQLSDILEYAARLQALDAAGLAAAGDDEMASGVAEPDLRPDEPQPPLERENLLRTAPDPQAGQFRVPPVLDSGA